MTVAEVQFFSPSIGRHSSYQVIIPDEGDGPFPVVMQLHGLSDDFRCWTQKANLTRHAAPYPMLVVLPDGGTDGYLNLQSDERLHRHSWEDAMVKDVVGHVRRAFNVRDGKWAIGGLSMGGYGSMRLGLKHPDLFGSIWSHSSAFHIGEALAHRLADPADRDIWTVVERTLALPEADRPVISFDCGVDDYLIDGNRDLHARMDAAGLPHHYAEHPGAHTWEYWDDHVREALAQHARFFGLPAAQG